MTIGTDEGHLTIDGPTGVWPRTRLLRVASGRYVIEPLPIEATFTTMDDGPVLELNGPSLHGGKPSGTWRREAP